MRLLILALVFLLRLLAMPTNLLPRYPLLWGSPTADNGACCETLGEVWKNIDRLDREIVHLMAERGRYIYEAARFKANPAQVEAPERADAVVRKAILLAQENGLSPKLAETTCRAMVRSFIDYEQEIFPLLPLLGKPLGRNSFFEQPLDV